jgi:ribosome maturation factor RimP
MELTEKIAQLLDEKYTTDEVYHDCFTVDIEYRANSNRLHVFIDSDSAMTFEKCHRISRYLESFIDTNNWMGEKYVLEVSSPGVNRPLKFTRQYIKNIGREVEVTFLDKTTEEGTLIKADETKIVLTKEVVEKDGKKKIKKQVEIEIPYTNIHKAIVQLVF